MLAALILLFHLVVIAFNLVGIVIIPLGAWRGWIYVRAPVWRLAHVASLAVTALQAALGRACILTIWQAEFSDRRPTPKPLIMEWVNSLIFWPLPAWAFVLIYFLTLAYVLCPLWLVPLRWRARG
jgi:hypothetical protein